MKKGNTITLTGAESTLVWIAIQDLQKVIAKRPGNCQAAADILDEICRKLIKSSLGEGQ